jgi:hypothetical protein
MKMLKLFYLTRESLLKRRNEKTHKDTPTTFIVGDMTGATI